MNSAIRSSFAIVLYPHFSELSSSYSYLKTLVRRKAARLQTIAANVQYAASLTAYTTFAAIFCVVLEGIRRAAYPHTICRHAVNSYVIGRAGKFPTDSDGQDNCRHDYCKRKLIAPVKFTQALEDRLGALGLLSPRPTCTRTGISAFLALVRPFLEALMARVTVEDCIDKVENRFDLVLVASHRARMIASGQPITVDRDRDKNPVVALREIADGTLQPDDLREDLIHSLQKHVEVDEPEAEVVPALAPAGEQSDAAGDVQFDRMTEEDLLRGLEGLVPPAETEEDAE